MDHSKDQEPAPRYTLADRAGFLRHPVEVLRAIERELPRSKVFVHGDPV